MSAANNPAHVVLSDFSTTGDGLLAALQVLAVMVETGKRLSSRSRVRSAPRSGQPQVRAQTRSAASPFRMPSPQPKKCSVRAGGFLCANPAPSLIRVMAQAETDDLVAEAVDGIVAALDKN